MKPKQKIISLLLTICLVAGLVPTAAFAAGTDTGKAIQLGTSGISGYDSTKGYDYIYYGTWDSSAIKWRVLATKTNTGASGLFLLSDALLGTDSNGGVYFDNSGKNSNAWQNSTAQKWCGTFYNRNFSTGEQGAVLATTKSDVRFISSNRNIPPFADSEKILNGDKVFFLSAEEAEKSAYGFTNDNARIANYGNSASVWWLRSPLAVMPSFAGVVTDTGGVHASSVNYGRAARPAFNLDLNSVLFTSAAVGGKIPAAEAADAIFEIGEYDGNEWKLTLLDSSREFGVTEETASGKPGDTITLNYTGATTGENEYISVIIEDESGAQYYGRVAQPNNERGQIEIKIPASLADGTYTLNVFSEQYNGGENDNTKLTDYASAFETVALTVDNTAAPVAVTGVTIDETLSVNIGQTKTPSFTVAPAEATNKTVSFTSDNPAVATVNATTGEVTGVSKGTTVITVKTADGNFTDTCTVTVSCAHSYTAETKKAEAMKTAGNCRDKAVYYYSCSVCGNVEHNDAHTFEGDKDANTHVGGTSTVNASEPDHKNQVDGYTGDTKCLGCGEIIATGTSIPAGAHTPSSTWNSDGTYHWKECTTMGCGVEIDGSKAKHSSTGENIATCQHKAVCDVCNVEYGALAAHNPASGWTSDASGHWHACTACGDKTDIAAHDYGTDKTCDICGYTKSSGGGYIPTIQKPTIEAGEGVKVTLSADGTVATIKVDAGYDLADVVLNGVSKGKVTEVKGLKTGDKLVVTATKKDAEPTDPTDEAILATLADQKLVARSKVVTMKNGKKAVRITWYNQNGEMMEFDGVQIFRSVKRNSGYGKKPIFTSETDKYYNTAIKAGTKYYYKVRGFVEIDGQKYYTDWSLKAWRTVK